MLILCLDCSTQVAGVALVDEDRCYYEIMVNAGNKHSRTLLSLIDAGLKETGKKPEHLKAIAVTKGPGSFTGLRIGLATAKGLAMAWDKPLVGVPTLDVLAAGWGWMADLVCPVLNARKGEVYAAVYKTKNDEKGRLTEYMALSPERVAIMCRELLLKEGGNSVALLGDGALVAFSSFEKVLARKVVVPPYPDSWLRPSVLGREAIKLIKVEGYQEDVFELVPLYVRPSEAEVKLGMVQGGFVDAGKNP